jgi:hypothetical protein
MRITNVEKKQLSDIFHKLKLNIFDFDATGEYEVFKIKFKYDYFSFAITKLEPNVYQIDYFSVGNKNAISTAVTWNDLLQNFLQWSKQLFAEFNSPTGWESFENTNFLNAEYDELNNEFTDAEKIQTKQSIKDLKVKIKILNLTPEKIEIIHNKLDSLSSKVDELNKFDWKSMFIGTIASLIMTFVVPQEVSGMFWEYIKSSFNNLKISA